MNILKLEKLEKKYQKLYDKQTKVIGKEQDKLQTIDNKLYRVQFQIDDFVFEEQRKIDEANGSGYWQGEQCQ